MRRLLGRLLQVLGVVVVVLVVLVVLLVVFVDPAEDRAGSAEGSAEAETHGLSFAVRQVKQARTRKGTLAAERARGVFVFVTVRATNTGDEPAAVLVESRFVGGNGKEYSTADIDSDDPLTVLLAGGWPIELQPDFSQRATLTFDVARRAVRGARLRLEVCEVELATEETFRATSCEDVVLALGL